MTVRIEHHRTWLVVVSDHGREDRFEFGHPDAALAWVRTIRR